MSKMNWTHIIALAGIALVVLLSCAGGVWILFGAGGGMMDRGTLWPDMMGRLCPWCGGGQGWLGNPRALLFMAFMIVLPLGLLFLLVLGVVWLVRRANPPGSSRPQA